MKTNSVKILSAAALGFFVQAAIAGNITGINVSVLPDKQRVVKVKFDKGAVEPSGFITTSPAQIALDFPGTDVRMSQPSLSFNDSLLGQVSAAQGNNSARVVLGLNREGQYNTQIKGNEVWIYVSEAAVQQNSFVDGGKSGKSTAPGFNIDFRQGAGKSGIVEFSAGGDEPKIKTQNDRIIVTLKNYPLATQDQRNFDVTDFSTPVRSVVVRRLGNDTQITIRNQGSWEHKISKSNGRHVIQVIPNRNVASDGYGLGDKKRSFKGKRVSLDFQNVEVRTILQVLAKESGMNIVASDTVQGKMTITLKDVPWDQALDLVLEARDLGKQQQGNIINIAPKDEIIGKRIKDLEGRKKMDDLGVRFTRSFQLKYKNVDDFKKILNINDNGGSSNSNNKNSILSERGSALIDPATNTLIVTDIQSVIEKFERLINELDVPSRQVMVEARIVEAEETVSRDLGVRFGYARGGHTSWSNNIGNAIQNFNVGTGRAFGNGSTGSGSNSGSNNSGGSSSNKNSLLLGPNVSLPVANYAGSLALVRAVGSGALALELTAMEQDNRSKTISTPRVMTQDRMEAEIRQGYQIPYQTRDTDGSLETSFKDAVMSLKVTPRITPDSKVILDIVINKDDADWARTNASGEPGIKTKQVKTQAMIEDGGTLIVGGIYQETLSSGISKVPVLGDLPILGNLFKSRSRKSERNELLFFITPRIMGGESSVLRY